MNEAAPVEPFSTKTAQPYAKWLWLCAGLFAFRVVAQLAALLFKPNFLPTFESWHGGVLPYPLLLTTQILILIWLAWTASQFSKNNLQPRRRLGMAIVILASLYFLLMLLRLLLGLTILSEHRWFASYLPAFFHLVLASYLFLYGHFHFRHGK
ncbi:MAG: hypothetical protein ABL880_07445 [Methylotenera sp.]